MSIYIHIPFCAKKCDYCAFYSFCASQKQMDEYLLAVNKYIDDWSHKFKKEISTIYFGGGTPSVFGGERIASIIAKIRSCFTVSKDCEITVECNPSSTDEKLIKALAKADVNRISMGLQSVVESERKAIGRLSDPSQVKKAVSYCKKYGIDNFSLDLMLGLPGQTIQSLGESLDFIVGSGAKHCSAYILKLEEGTPLAKRDNLVLPSEDETADMYIFVGKYLHQHGFKQYEVSNYAIPGYESVHNSNYWRCEEYIGIGPSAHSFINGKRLFYPNDFEEFIKGTEPIFDDYGGDEEEYIMLALRLCEGLSEENFFTRYGHSLGEKIFEKARFFEKHKLLNVENNNIALNNNGFLLSNQIIFELIEAYEQEHNS